MVTQNTVLQSPITTEKTVNTTGKVAFKVHNQANKDDVSKAIKAFYGVDVDKVNIIRLGEKYRRANRGQQACKRKSYKKAIVTLKAGQTLNFNDFK